MKTCKYCGGEIIDTAKKCKHCGEWVDINCPFCYGEISPSDTTCPHCGEKLLTNRTIDVGTVIENYINKTPLKTKLFLVKENLTNDKINESGMSFEQDEKPLLLLYKKFLWIDYTCKTRLLITDKKLYYKTNKDAWFTSFTAGLKKPTSGECKILGLDSLEIAEHDHCIGTAYIGHQLKINNEVKGLIRFSSNYIEYDSNAIEFLNNLFNELANNKIIENKVKEYIFQ